MRLAPTLFASLTLTASAPLNAAPQRPPAPEAPGCPADLDGDGFVGSGDLLILVSDWGRGSGTSDLWGPDEHPDGTVNIYDLLALLQSWGPC
jgi:hypothetical protein